MPNKVFFTFHSFPCPEHTNTQTHKCCSRVMDFYLYLLSFNISDWCTDIVNEANGMFDTITKANTTNRENLYFQGLYFHNIWNSRYHSSLHISKEKECNLEKKVTKML